MEIKFEAIKKKAFLAFFLTMLALISVYYIYKIALENIQISVEELAQPNHKLSTVNALFFEINKSEKSFRALMNTDSEKAINKFIVEAKNIQNLADSLSKTCKESANQSAIMDSIQMLLLNRNSLLLEYLSFKENLKKNNPIHKQLRKLNQIVAADQESEKALVRTKEERNITYKIDTLTVFQEKQNFWSKLFNRNKEKGIQFGNTKKETIHSNVDTIILSRKNEQQIALQKMISELGAMQTESLKKHQRQELKIIQFEKQFNAKISELLMAIENEFLIQTQINKAKAETTILESIGKLKAILFVFVLSALIVLVFTYLDLHKIDHLSRLLEKARANAIFETQAKQRFLSNMSHEIRTPLQSIIGYTEQLIKTPNQHHQFLPIIHQSSEHLLQVVNEILDYSRINAGKFTFEKWPFDLNQSVEEIIAIVVNQANEKGLKLYVSMPEKAKHLVNGDAFRLKQILLNLLSNAIKFTQTGSIQLILKTELKDGIENCYFSIADTGIGIPDKRISQIFDAFEQAHQENSYTGSGLGLSITKALVEEQGGSIAVKSELGKGTIFRFTICYPISNQKVDMIENTQIQIMNKNLVVWMVDDDHFIRNLCSIIFNQNNIQHICFSSAQELLNVAKQQQPDILFADIRMPGKNGFELWSELHILWGKQVPIYALSAQALPPEKERILAHGFDGIISKPFKEQDLLQCLQHVSPKNWVQQESSLLCNFDFSNLQKMLGSNQERLISIVKEFQDESNADLLKIQALLQLKNTEELALYIHKLAGRFAQLGASELAILLRDIEKKLDAKVPIQEIHSLSHCLEKVAYNNNELLNMVFLHFGIERTSIDI